MKIIKKSTQESNTKREKTNKQTNKQIEKHKRVGVVELRKKVLIKNRPLALRGHVTNSSLKQ